MWQYWLYIAAGLLLTIIGAIFQLKQKKKEEEVNKKVAA
jgi:hypothetical protein